MNSLVSLVFVLFVGCASAGIVVDLISQKTATADGFREGTAYGRTETEAILGSGAFVMELVPFTNGKKVTQTHVRLLWRDTQMNYYTLELIRMNWPSGNTPIIAVAKGSIKPNTFNPATKEITVKYLRQEACTTKTYTWKSSKYVGGTFTETGLRSC